MEPDGFHVSTFPAARLATTDVGRIGLRKHYMFSLLEVDATAARESARGMRRQGQAVSFTAWILKAVSQSVHRNPAVQAMRLGKLRLVTFDDVDIAIPVERKVGDAGVPLPLLIKATNRKSVMEIQAELDQATRQTVQSEKDYILSRHRFSRASLRLYYRLPQWTRVTILGWLLARNPFRAKRNSGTVLVTTVNAIGRSAGWILPTRSLHNLSVGLGSISRKPWVVDGKVVVRDILHLTISMNHDVIDGVPARRFVQDLASIIESGRLE